MGPYDILYTALYVTLPNLTEIGNTSFYVLVLTAIILIAYEF